MFQLIVMDVECLLTWSMHGSVGKAAWWYKDVMR